MNGELKGAILFYGGMAVVGGATVVAKKWYDAKHEDDPPEPPKTKQELLAENALSTKILGGLMVGLPVVAGASVLGMKGLDRVAAGTTGIPKLLATGASGVLAVTGGVAALGAIPLWGGWGFVGLIAASNEREDILAGKNPYEGE